MPYLQETNVTQPDDLIDTLLAAHGGLDHWRSLSKVTTSAKTGGALFSFKQQEGTLADVRIEADLRRQRTTTTPFGGPGVRGVFEGGRVALERADGTAIEERADGRPPSTATA